MYVCLCNRLRDADLEAAIDAGARDAAEVFETLGVQPHCGGCLDFADDVVNGVLAARYRRAS